MISKDTLLIVVINFISEIHCLRYDLDELDCGTLRDRWLPQIWVPWNEQGRAFLTVPSQLEIKPSRIPKSGLGVFARTFIPKYTWLGESQGELVLEDILISDYAWTLTRRWKTLGYTDSYDIQMSDWTRFMNCPRNKQEENVHVFYCKTKILFMNMKDLYPDSELLVYYGEEYAKDLNITEFD